MTSPDSSQLLNIVVEQQEQKTPQVLKEISRRLESIAVTEDEKRHIDLALQNLQEFVPKWQAFIKTNEAKFSEEERDDLKKFIKRLSITSAGPFYSETFDTYDTYPKDARIKIPIARGDAKLSKEFFDKVLKSLEALSENETLASAELNSIMSHGHTDGIRQRTSAYGTDFIGERDVVVDGMSLRYIFSRDSKYVFASISIEDFEILIGK